MLFNSVTFALFFCVVFCLYWVINKRSLTLQNIFLLIASYIFYGWWDWRFTSLIAFSSIVDFSIGWQLHKAKTIAAQRVWLSLSLVTNLGLLSLFKYYNFFVESILDALQSLGLQPNIATLSLILPVGISFYTFQTLSYTIDIYKGQMKPTKDFIAFLAFVSFFPQLVAGPIERAANLLPQFLNRRTFNAYYAQDGIRLILWGLFKKMVIADNLASYVDVIFQDYSQFTGLDVALGAVFFAIQIYCDFSGYSDIAIGTASLLGFRLMRNFNFPYFATSIGDFWRRWHISLSTWFRDYLFIPLGGSRVSKARHVFNILVVFIVSGFWHGANWTFIIWGAIHGLMYLPSLLFTFANSKKNGAITVIRILALNSLIVLAWIFFRASSVSQAVGMVAHIFTTTWFETVIPAFNTANQLPLWVMLSLIVGMFGFEFIQRNKDHPLQLDTLWVPLRWTIYYALVFGIALFSQKTTPDFIYFQF